MFRFIGILSCFCLTFLVGLGAVAGLRSIGSPQPEQRVGTTPPKAAESYDFFSPPVVSTEMPELPPGFKAKKTYCTDRRIRPIWNAIRRDKEWRKILEYTLGSPNCVDMFEVAKKDLNGDGMKEVMVRGMTGQLCGGVGNCELWVFEVRNGKYRLLLNSSDYHQRSPMGKQVRSTRTNGYRDLLLTWHLSASDTSFTDYKFNGRKYVESRCRYETPEHIPNSDRVRWRFVPCDRF